MFSNFERDNTLIKRLELQYKRPQGEGHSVCEAEGKGQRYVGMKGKRPTSKRKYMNKKNTTTEQQISK